jgi:hypothetical protein
VPGRARTGMAESDVLKNFLLEFIENGINIIK